MPEHPKLYVAGWSRDERWFFCYCCGRHELASYCVCCDSRACTRCLQWQYECRRPGDAWCTPMHVALRTCRHREVLD